MFPILVSHDAYLVPSPTLPILLYGLHLHIPFRTPRVGLFCSGTLSYFWTIQTTLKKVFGLRNFPHFENKLLMIVYRVPMFAQLLVMIFQAWLKNYSKISFRSAQSLTHIKKVFSHNKLLFLL